jgi:hypothetical protein
MSTWVWIVIIAAVVLALLLIAAAVMRRRQQRSAELREGFGPEYDRTVEDTGSRRRAEAELAERQERREELDIRPLTPAARDRYMDRWRDTQTHFVDDPGSSVGGADSLVQEVMRERGYPTDDFEQRAADISVDHPHIVEHYRSAHEIALAHERGEASTEDLRQSLVHYRALFEELLETGAPERVEAQR